MDVCSITDGSYTMKYIMQVIGEPDENGLYPLYDRLIEDMTLLCNADPNRVYLLGFSAGGDGVYAIAPRMADRFAAVNQSSGHPNGVTLLNNANLPTCIQSGIRDTMFSPKRSVASAGFEQQLDAYNGEFGFGYAHEVYIHVPEGHNYNDNNPTVDNGERVVKADFKIDEAEIFASMTNTMDWDLAYAAHISFSSLGFDD